VNKNNGLLYTKIEKYIINLIDQGSLQVGDHLPPERELGKKFNASHVPVRQAIESLINKGILERVYNKGTFVKSSRARTKTNTLGILYWPDDINFYRSPFYSAILSGIKLQAERAEKILLFRSMLDYYQSKKTKDVFKGLMAEVDGFIILEMIQDMYEDIIIAIREMEKPAVVLAASNLPPDIDGVIFDHYGNTKRVFQFLIDNGHKRIGYLFRQSKFYDEDSLLGDRKAAIRETLEENGVRFDEALLRSYPRATEGAAIGTTLQELMNGKNPVTAIACFDDSAAYVVYDQARQLNIRIPEDLTVIGYDNLREEPYVYPLLTTLHLPIMELGVVGVRRLLEKVDEQNDNIKTTYQISMPGEMIIRDSHKNIKSEIRNKKSETNLKFK
jgi:DNA-binding LacI/PurR family transcriptional regulator